MLTLDELLAPGLPVALVFSDADCGPCTAAVPTLAGAQREWAERLTIAVISRGVTPQSEAAWREHQLERIGIVPAADLAIGYGIVGWPAAVLVSAEGLIDSGPALGIAEIEALLHAGGAMRAPYTLNPQLGLGAIREERIGHVEAA
jgi:hypothetical protein